MPCQLCRNHYHEWRKNHPLEEIDKLRGPLLKEGVREWLYNLHENVNKTRGIESGILLEQIPELYKQVNFKEAWGDFYTQIKSSTEIGLVSQTVLQAFHRRFGMLRKLVGKY
jgi:hypothetical protein